jgi:predicted HNH restriction endonuclease
MPPHYGTGDGKNHYREQFSIEEFVCRRCGYKEFSNSVAIHHIDKNRNNNDKSNLIPLCFNCHNALHDKIWNIEEILSQ